MSFYLYDWTPENIEHLAQHDVTPEEFVEVVSDPDDTDINRSSGNDLAFGWTSTGRYLCCVYRIYDNGMTVEPVSAYEIEY